MAWFKKVKTNKQSEFYSGESIFTKLNNSLYANICSTFKELFNEDEIKEYMLPKVILIGNESHGKSRLTCCQSIALIKEMNMQHNTILALTMVDRLQPENMEDLLIKRIIQSSDEIKDLDFNGCIGIINRVHLTNKTLQENDILERKWFDENILNEIPEEYIDYKSIIENNLTITNLLQSI
jgi:hypothetical protein